MHSSYALRFVINKYNDNKILKKMVLFSMALLILDNAIYYFELDYIDPVFRHLLKYDGIEFIYLLPDLFYYLVYIVILFAYFLIYLGVRIGNATLLSAIVLITISYLLSGVRFVSSVTDLLAVIIAFFWGGILYYTNFNRSEHYYYKSQFNKKNISIYLIVLLFNLQLFISYSDVFDGDMYFEWAKYDAPALNEQFFLLGIIFIHISLLGVFFKKKWGRVSFYIATVYYLLFSILSGIRICVPEMMIIRLVMEIIWGGLLFVLYTSPEKQGGAYTLENRS